MVQALVAVEDRRFYSHYGLDPIRIVGAACRNLRAGRDHRRAAARLRNSSREPFACRLRARSRESCARPCWPLRLEERYSKAQILQEYLNTVYFGEGFYGVEAASRGYFGKPASEFGAG